MLRSGVDSGESFRALVRKRRLLEATEVLGAQPWLWMVAVVGPVAAGALASFYPADIKSGLYPFFWAGTRVDFIASAFWMSVALTGLSFGLVQWSQSRAGAALRTMIRRMQSLPPGGFLEAFQDAFRVAAKQSLLVLLNPASTSDQTEHAIRNVLGAIVELARDFDEQDSAIYSANLMLWRPSGSAFESVEPVLLTEARPDDRSVRGHLELITCLSTTTESQGGQYNKDPNIMALVLPVPVNADKVLDWKNHARDPVFPGAAQAFLRGDYVSFASVEEYVTWLHAHSSCSVETVNALKQFIVSGKGNTVKSFGARPIEAVGAEAGIIGVLNIHSNREDVLQDSGQTLFAPLIEPFCFLLGALIKKRQVLLSSGQEREPQQ